MFLNLDHPGFSSHYTVVAKRTDADTDVANAVEIEIYSKIQNLIVQQEFFENLCLQYKQGKSNICEGSF